MRGGQVTQPHRRPDHYSFFGASPLLSRIRNFARSRAISSATSTKKADPTGPLRRSRPNRTPGYRRRAGMLSRRLYDGVGESLDHRGARTLLVVKPESPRELSSALTGRLEISPATTIRHSQ